MEERSCPDSNHELKVKTISLVGKEDDTAIAKKVKDIDIPFDQETSNSIYPTKKRARESFIFHTQNGKLANKNSSRKVTESVTKVSSPVHRKGASSINIKAGSISPASPDFKKSRSLGVMMSNHDEEFGEQKLCYSSKIPYMRLESSSSPSDVDGDSNDDHSSNSFLQPRIPIAPSLELYLQEDGALKYRPRPEWCRTPKLNFTNKIQLKSMRNGDEMLSSKRVNGNDIIINNPPIIQDPVSRGNQHAPENGLLSDQIWSGKPDLQRSGMWIGQSADVERAETATTIFPSLQINRRGRAGFQRNSNIWQQGNLFESRSNDEESDNVSNELSQRLLSSFEEDSSAILSPSALKESESIYTLLPDEIVAKDALFGNEQNTALHIAIQDHATEAAFQLIRLGAPIDFQNAKGITPIVAASQKGNHEVVHLLLKMGANPVAATFTGSTALIQASHFGHVHVVECLLKHGAMVEQANYKNTTAIMRAAQEGHKNIVKLLLKYHCNVNRENNDKMTALMLAAQRGHSEITQMLLRAGARVDVKTAQDSTSLMLACKRGHTEVAQILIAFGSELMLRDSRGRTARDIATRKGLIQLASMMTQDVQICLMKKRAMLERMHLMLWLSGLLQQGRASVKAYSGNNQVVKHRGCKYIHELCGEEGSAIMGSMCKSKSALVQTMILPIPLVGHIASYLPTPHLWEKRLEMLTKRCQIDADSTISCALDLIDEVLEVEGFVEACDKSGITSPANYESWAEWKMCGRSGKHAQSFHLLSITSTCKNEMQKENITKQNLLIERECNIMKMRRDACFLQLLAHRSPLLAKTLLCSPYEIPEVLIQKLKNNSDIQSLVRRLGSYGVHFEVSVAMEILMLASQLVLWHYSSTQLQCSK